MANERRSGLGKISQRLAQALFPTVCAACGGRGALGMDLCDPCRAELPYLRTACTQCALPLPIAAVCGVCLQDPPSFDVAHAAFRYARPIDRLLQNLKFQRQLYPARLLGDLMIASLAKRAHSWPQLLVPVPLHRNRVVERGYNQALELARPLSRHFGIPIDSHLLTRAQATPPQSDLPREARHKNVQGAFTVARPLAASHIALIDDVMTTGATLHAAAQALRAANAARIEVWVVARAV